MKLLKKFCAPLVCMALTILWGTDDTWFGLPVFDASAGETVAAKASAKLRYTKLAVGGLHSCAVTEANGLKCWGDNFRGQIGDGTVNDRLAPVTPIGLARGVKSVSAGSRHTCVLLASGEVDCWGQGDFGQLGDGQGADYYSPGRVPAIGNAGLDVAAGDLHTCAIVTGGAVKCWGTNIHGELGDGTNNSSKVPVDVEGLPAGIVALALGNFYSCALSSRGRVYCWGQNAKGQLGDGTTQNRLTPVPVRKLSNIIAISASSSNQTCALDGSGAMFCWGDNQYGQVGDGTTATRFLPVRVSGLSSGVKAISAGNLHTCALMKSDRMKCWGFNLDGELGNGTRIDSLVPSNVVGSAAVALSSKGYHNCARTTRGKIVCWGKNGDGQLGIGNNQNSEDVPVQVKGF